MKIQKPKPKLSNRDWYVGIALTRPQYEKLVSLVDDETRTLSGVVRRMIDRAPFPASVQCQDELTEAP